MPSAHVPAGVVGRTESSSARSFEAAKWAERRKKIKQQDARLVKAAYGYMQDKNISTDSSCGML